MFGKGNARTSPNPAAPYSPNRPADNSRAPPQSRSSQQRRNRRPQRSKSNPIPIQPAMPRAARRHLEHQPLTLLSRDARQILTRDQKHVGRKPPPLPVPAEHTYKGRGGGPEARPPDIHPLLHVPSVPTRSLHLQSDKAPAGKLAHQHLNRLEVRKRPEQRKRVNLGKLADHLRLADEPLVSAIDRHSLRRGLESFAHSLKPLRQRFASHEKRRPTR